MPQRASSIFLFRIATWNGFLHTDPVEREIYHAKEDSSTFYLVGV